MSLTDTKLRPARVLVSACLLGINCNYKGSSSCELVSKEFLKAIALGHFLVPVCPEQLGGLSTPRVPCEIISSLGQLKVENKYKKDVTLAFDKGAKETVKIAKMYDVQLCVLRSRSPSCGLNQVYDGSFSGKLIQGSGVTAKALLKEGFAVIQEFDFSLDVLDSLSGA